ncbi:hypothetical protein [Frankia sp. CiP1_Cm_nod1]|uniref:hypothetical protein n=1 Tax=Frankia sp. CiP1_Cm_nod1 TaxID=2897160 RepID=UPI0020241F23
MEFGRLVQRLWLTLARRRLAAHPQSHLIDCPATVGPLLELTAAVAERPLRITRAGRPDPEQLRRVPLPARRVRAGQGRRARAGHSRRARAGRG